MLERGEIDAAQAERMQSLFGDLSRDYRRQFGDQAADAMASEATLTALARDLAVRKQRALLQVQSQRRAWLDMQTFGTGAGGLRVLDATRPGHMGEAAQALIARSEYAPYRNVEYQARAIRGPAHGTIRHVLAKHRRDLLGRVRQGDDLVDLVRARFGEKVENADAVELSDAVGEVFESLRLRRNAAGGNTGKLDNYGLPQRHDSQLVADAGYQSWRDFILPRLDRARMIDQRTGQPFSDEALELVLRDVYEVIATDGWSALNPGAVRRGSMAGARDHHRFLHFASADDWLAYHERFGGNMTPFDIINGHIDAMSREIAAMEVLGPNPAATVRWLQDVIKNEASGRSANHRAAALRTANELGRLYDTHVGNNLTPERPRVALGFGAVRALQVATKLGSAVLSTTSDQATQVMARRFNGLPVARMVLSQARMLNPANAEHRMLAVRAGMIWEGASTIAAAQARMTGEELSGEVASRMAEATLRLSGLQAVTNSGRWAFGMDFLAYITDQRGVRWSALNPAFRGAFERYGFTEAGWDALRATELIEEGGATWILPESIRDIGLRDQLLRMIHSEMDMAVPVATLRTRTAFEAFAPRGTWIGEIKRTALQFKAFPVTIMMQQMSRIMAQQGWSRASYAANMMILTTIAGAAALELKEVAKYRYPRALWDPEDMRSNAEFWGAAMLQGGGLGIFGDFLKSSTNRFGGGIMSTLAGPAFQTADNLARLAIADPVQAVMDDVPGDGSGDVNPGRSLIRVLRSETPVIGSLWYTRLAYERIVLDQLSWWADNDPVDAFRRMERRAEEMGTEYFWAPGSGIHDARPPDVGDVLADD
jgi:hypothetical protein